MRFNSQMESHVVWWLLKVNHSRLVVWSTGQKGPDDRQPRPSGNRSDFLSVHTQKKSASWSQCFLQETASKRWWLSSLMVPSHRQLSPLTDRQKGRQADRQGFPSDRQCCGEPLRLPSCRPVHHHPKLVEVSPLTDSCLLWQRGVLSDRQTDRCSL